MKLEVEARGELLKLLLQVAWADGHVGEEERVMVTELAGRLGVSAAAHAELERFLDGVAPLPPPNMELLKTDKEAVLFAAKSLVRADLQIATDESQVVDVIRDLLYNR